MAQIELGSDLLPGQMRHNPLIARAPLGHARPQYPPGIERVTHGAAHQEETSFALFLLFTAFAWQEHTERPQTAPHPPARRIDQAALSRKKINDNSEPRVGVVRPSMRENVRINQVGRVFLPCDLRIPLLSSPAHLSATVL
eukprot:m.221937 g.221937  ORF g.221937 m.221937 type:complete len:141 (+) comp54170_c1_seq13:138-560(+)